MGAGLCLALIASGCGESRRGSEHTTSGGSSGAGVAGGGAGGVAGSASGGSAGGPGGSAGAFFIEGRVDGELVRIEVDVHAYWFHGLTQGYLIVQALTDELGWAVTVPNYDGADTCGAGTITLIHNEGDTTTYHLSDPLVGVKHGCSISVDHAAPHVGDVIEGTFSGELTPLPGDRNATISVTEGAFRAPRIADGLPAR